MVLTGEGNGASERSPARFYVALLERKLNKGTPNGCKVIHEEKISLNFSSEKLTLAKVFKCD